jgi:peptidyl-prolyl cis-trans isomerase C
MSKSWTLCVLLGALAWGQAAPSVAPQTQSPQAPAVNQMTPQAPAAADTSESVPESAAVITVKGVCSPAPSRPASQATAAKPATAAKTSQSSAPAADCKTVITKAEFEKLASSLSPSGSVSPQLKRQLGGMLPRVIAMSNQARKEGMDKTDQYKETVKFVQMQVLANELQKKLQTEAQNIPDADIQKYYDEHKADFEQYTLDRLFVPRMKQNEPDLKDENEKDKTDKPSEDQIKAKQAAEKAKSDANEQAMTKLADDLHARAAAGEDFTKLQKEAFEAAGMKIESPSVSLANVRRNGLSPSQSAVFALQPGEVSQVISENGGHYIYKMKSESELPLDQAKNEIHGRLQSEHMREMMDKLNGSFKVETNEAYFGPGAPAGMPPRPGPAGMGRPASPQPGTPPPSSQAQAPPSTQDSDKH